MFDIVENIIDHVWTNDYGSSQQYVFYICGSLITIFAASFVDLVYRIFSHFWNGKR